MKLKPKIEKLIRGGVPHKQIQLILGCSTCYISQVRKGINLAPLKRGRKRGKNTKLIIRDYSNGMTQSDIARMYNLSKQRINQIIYSEKYNARANLYYRIRNGKILKPDKCEQCGFGENIQAHHRDYKNRNDIKWLCEKCHKGLHKADGSLKRKIKIDKFKMVGDKILKLVYFYA